MEEAFINSVKKHDVLYNHQLADYRDKHKRQEGWEEIAREFKTTAKAAKEKWEKLRRCFTNARNRRLRKSGRTAKKMSAWKYDQQMEFLLPFLEDRAAYSTLSDTQNSSVKSETVIQDLDYDSEDEENIEEENVPSIEDEQHQVVAKEDVKKLQYQTTMRKKVAPQMVDITKDHDILSKRKYEENSISSNKRSILEDIDETDMFFLSMSRMTKRLPKVEQANIKLALSTSVLQAEIRCTQKQYNNCIDAPPQRFVAQHQTSSSSSSTVSPDVSPTGSSIDYYNHTDSKGSVRPETK